MADKHAVRAYIDDHGRLRAGRRSETMDGRPVHSEDKAKSVPLPSVVRVNDLVDALNDKELKQMVCKEIRQNIRSVLPLVT